MAGTTEGTDPKSAERNLRLDYENLRKDEKLRQEAEAYERSKRDEKGESLLNFGLKMMRKSEKPKGMKEGGAVRSASSRADGCAIRGKTKGRIV